MTASRYRGVLFDLDGTLIDTAPDFAACLNLLLATENRPPVGIADIRELITDGSAALISVAFGYTADDPRFEPLRQRFLTLYLANSAVASKPFPGIEPLLLQLGDRGIPWGIVTNKPDRYTRALLRDLPLTPPPATVICPDQVTHTKPHPEPVLLACRELDLAPADVIFIGDHRRDIDAGRTAGTATVAAAYGYVGDTDPPRHWGAHHLINAVAELHALLF
ncbi:MAG: HAD family hydrolase [Porticoccaceae bacterium]